MLGDPARVDRGDDLVLVEERTDHGILFFGRCLRRLSGMAIRERASQLPVDAYAGGEVFVAFSLRTSRQRCRAALSLARCLCESGHEIPSPSRFVFVPRQHIALQNGTCPAASMTESRVK